MIANKKLTLIILLVLVLGGAQILFAHCQVPCGIYDDQLRVKAIAEHITTIEKAMTQVNQLSAVTPVNYNQIVRWVTNKEKHAEQLSDIVTYYFMAQRIKPADAKDKAAYDDYTTKLNLLHLLLVNTMKAKQSTDLKVIESLRDLLKKFEAIYFKETHS